ncbi:hypothetical protein [Bradyrhizobium elkanii]|uniref:hypothetical protein n=1 Tax=Bradyrhizobium elkanii TaxID=29448 RepID=UPI00159F2518|nr:hypothetical protein [Bradyrhizobium elkanii]
MRYNLRGRQPHVLTFHANLRGSAKNWQLAAIARAAKDAGGTVNVAESDQA